MPIIRCQLTTEEVVNAKMISDPMTRLMCCPQSDGAAAAIVCTREIAARYTTKPVKIAASVVLSAPYEIWDEELTDATLIGLLSDKTYENSRDTVPEGSRTWWNCTTPFHRRRSTPINACGFAKKARPCLLSGQGRQRSMGGAR